jgi:hypothetical protein
MTGILKKIRQLHADQAGAVTLEWVLLLVAFGLPLAAIVFPLLVKLMAENYKIVVFLETLPFP